MQNDPRKNLTYPIQVLPLLGARDQIFRVPQGRDDPWISSRFFVGAIVLIALVTRESSGRNAVGKRAHGPLPCLHEPRIFRWQNAERENTVHTRRVERRIKTPIRAQQFHEYPLTPIPQMCKDRSAYHF